MEKRNYTKPQAISFPEKINNGVPGALYGALLMVVRAVAKAMKGGIELAAGHDEPRTLQRKK